MAARIRKDDVVVVIGGAHKGSRGKVLRVVPEEGRVFVEGVNMVLRHLRKTQANPQGGRVHKEAALHLSKVALIDPKTDKATRVRFAAHSEARSRKQRVSVQGAVIGPVTRAARGG
jgi:large subunit ribosomal protein L24